MSARDGLVAVVEVVAQAEHVVVRALGVQDEESVFAYLRSTVTVSLPSPVLSHVVVRTPLRRCVPSMRDRVGEAARPDADAVGERAGRCGPERDARRRQPDDEDLAGRGERGIPSERRSGDVGDEDVRVAGARALVAQQQGVAARAEVEVERAVDVVEVAREELGLLGRGATIAPSTRCRRGRCRPRTRRS